MEIAISAARFVVSRALGPVSDGLLESWAACSELAPNVRTLKLELLYAQGMLDSALGRDVRNRHVRNPALGQLLLELRHHADKAEDDELDKTHETADAPDLVGGLVLNARHTARDVVSKLKLPSCSCTSSVCQHYRKPKLKFNRAAMSKRMVEIVEQLKPVCAKVSTILDLELLGTIASNGSTSTTQKGTVSSSHNRNTTPTIIEPKLYGRDKPKNGIVGDITQGKYCANNLTVLSIVGPGGLGKTTLTQHIYQEVRSNFQVRVWICVSQNFSANMLAQEIVKQIPKVDNEKENENVEDQIEKRLHSKRFLLVLDDMWTHHEDEWKKLLALFKKGEKKEHTKLHDIGWEIVRRLKGFPLAVKTVGKLLKTELTLDHWTRIFESKEWEYQVNDDDITPALKLSYNYLPFHLQQCFSHCALFPEDYEFGCEELIHLWIGLGFLVSDNQNKRIEDIGSDYLNDLVSHGFFQNSKKEDGHTYYIIHDLLHDLAKNVSAYDCLSIQGSNLWSVQIPASVLHMSIITENANVQDRTTFQTHKRGLDALAKRLKQNNFTNEPFPKLFAPVDPSSGATACGAAAARSGATACGAAGRLAPLRRVANGPRPIQSGALAEPQLQRLLRTMADFVRVKKEAMEGLLKLEEDACDVKRQLVPDRDSVKEGQDQLHCRSSQDSLDAQSFKHFDVCDNFDLAFASDRLDGASLREMGDQDDGEISLGSEDGEEESDEDGSGQSEEEEFASEEEEGSEEDGEGEGEVSLGGDDEEEGSEEDGNGDSQQEDEEEYDRGVSDNYYDQEDVGGSGTRGAVEVLYGHHSNLNEEQGGGDEEGRGRKGGHYNEEEGGGDGHHSEDGESRENDEEESGGDEEDGARESGHYNEEEQSAGGHNCEDDESLEDDQPLEDGRGGDRRMLMVVHAQQGSWAQVQEDDRTMLQEHGVEIPQVHFHDDVSGADLARCDTGLATIREGSARDWIIQEGLRFETLEKVQFFLQDYAVRHHRPYKVKHSNAGLRYTVVCSQGCPWSVHFCRDKRNGGWKITSVKQPHTCGTSETLRVHAQNTARYIARRIAGIVAVDPEVTMKNLHETIFSLTGYRVSYSKAWRAKQYVMEMVYGDWKESYNLLPRVAHAIGNYNPATRWYTYTGGRTVTVKSGKTAHVLQRVFWCFGQCVAAFLYCWPVLLVDDTFLTGKYKGVLMMAQAVDPEDQLVPMAFAVVEAENNDSWQWFMHLLRVEVMGKERKICVISDRHAGILKACK
ncbi:hypothetical protein U9M48_037580 [Paspalum notatum var. saurae]|uniref:Uncharacterized protein n=1 Tax=Paspalum notatum var. saurae TaxID=547442 RepID=A0AAQ3X9G3_PASNO